MTITEGYLEHPVFRLVSETAAEQGVRAFVIGGYVRDCFLGRANDDIDIVVEGSGIALAEAVGEKVHARVSVFRNFGTAMLKYKGIELEFVGEGKRYWDLVRWELTDDPDGIKASTVLVPDDFGYRTNAWTASKKYLPIPQSEIDSAKGKTYELTQNNY